MIQERQNEEKKLAQPRERDIKCTMMQHRSSVVRDPSWCRGRNVQGEVRRQLFFVPKNKQEKKRSKQ